MLRAGIVAVALGVLGGLAGVWMGITLFASDQDETPSLHAMVHHELHLSPEQDALIEELETAFAIRRNELEAQMAAARQAMGEALLEDQELSEGVSMHAQAIHTAMGELQVETLSHILAMRAVLTDDQRASFDVRLADAFDAGQ
ncbi:periplasmic heavy metal sensor [Hyphobacterium sp.]|uniref:periplasmic heavy metal sensor n=1 Tax=Hyphobacterium sp. TaxID=2004662 RepID=UPI003BAD20A3